MTAAIVVAFLVRCVMVLIFLPFSAADKLLGFGHAVGQAQEVFRPRWLARAVILAGLAIEVVCSLGVVTGVSDRAAAFVIAGYCFATAVLFKPFWKPGDFWSDPDGRARGLFWDFLKNLALGAGFLLLVVGPDGSGLQPFLDAPLASSQPYRSP
ncbi:DoxX family protein [Paracidovorax avenae]|uniref:DoxX family membrane protein n=1 Tax=Paracidovorax avenae TaxID=80867 RepID=UPI000D203CCE|nr:DoxX family membrane protein [Paracidovorax avenae]AVS84579.1 DoxX family protein [Paracidovorax avenae]AVS91518.1 DoxX family protein [Paracidovorax avenae]AVS95599.1 DoxX family protein [Paracidovorax avenae]AVT02268.1 DoxX family protein [Paracidovorax avenae]AVT09176.1 DoxX family protein [Paracidovorax avenae]